MPLPARVAQGIEQLPSKQSVAGSNPATGTTPIQFNMSEDKKRYTVTIKWVAHGQYIIQQIDADSEEDAIRQAKEWDDDDLQSQVYDYRITEEQVEEDD